MQYHIYMTFENPMELAGNDGKGKAIFLRKI